jgi:hypothetical protein
MICINVMTQHLRKVLNRRRYVDRHPELHKNIPQTPESQRVHRYRRFEKNPAREMLRCKQPNAKAHGLEFSITEKDILPLPVRCPVLGIRINWAAGSGRFDDGPSIDRIDSSLGYITGNVRVISMRANRLKSDATVEEMRRILQYMEQVLG